MFILCCSWYRYVHNCNKNGIVSIRTDTVATKGVDQHQIFVVNYSGRSEKSSMGKRASWSLGLVSDWLRAWSSRAIVADILETSSITGSERYSEALKKSKLRCRSPASKRSSPPKSVVIVPADMFNCSSQINDARARQLSPLYTEKRAWK